MNSGDATAARASLEDAIESHMTWLGVDAASTTAYIDSLSATTDLELIMNEKYVAMFTSTESLIFPRHSEQPLPFNAHARDGMIPGRQNAGYTSKHPTFA